MMGAPHPPQYTRVGIVWHSDGMGDATVASARAKPGGHGHLALAAGWCHHHHRPPQQLVKWSPTPTRDQRAERVAKWGQQERNLTSPVRARLARFRRRASPSSGRAVCCFLGHAYSGETARSADAHTHTPCVRCRLRAVTVLCRLRASPLEQPDKDSTTMSIS